MEDRSRPLNIVLNEMLEEGYVMDFEVVEKIDSRSGDFVSDGVYQCREEEPLTDTVYVRAVSSEKLHIKAVTITTIDAHASNSVNDILVKIRSAIRRVLRFFQ